MSSRRPGSVQPDQASSGTAGSGRAQQGTASARARRWRPDRWAGRLALATGAAVPLAFVALFFFVPVGAMVALGFAPSGRLDLTALTEVFARPRTWRVIGLTLGQAAAASAISVLLALPAARLLYTIRFPGRGLLRAVVAVPFVLPTVVVAVAFARLTGPTGPLGFVGTWGAFPAILAALVFFNYSVAVRGIGALWAQLDHRAEQAARSLGASRLRAFATVTLPALRPAIGNAAALVFLFSATSFGVVLILGDLSYGTVETEIWRLTTQLLDLRGAAVLSVVQLVIVAACLWLTGRGTDRTGARLTADDDEALRGRHLPLVAITALTVLALAAPLAQLVLGSLRRRGEWTLANYADLAAPPTSGAMLEPVTSAIGHSLRYALAATAIALTLGCALAVVLSRRARTRRTARALAWFDALFMLPLGVSAVTVGFGLLLTMDAPPLHLRSAPVLIPIAQAIVALPLVVRALLPAMRAIDPAQREAAAVLGARPVRVFASVDLPVLGRALPLAAGFALAVSLGEFGATSFLARPETQTLPVVIYRLMGRPGPEALGMALAAAVVLAAVCAAAMMLGESAASATRRARRPGATSRIDPLGSTP